MSRMSQILWHCYIINMGTAQHSPKFQAVRAKLWVLEVVDSITLDQYKVNGKKTTFQVHLICQYLFNRGC